MGSNKLCESDLIEIVLISCLHHLIVYSIYSEIIEFIVDDNRTPIKNFNYKNLIYFV